MARGRRVKGFVDSLHDPLVLDAVSSISSSDTTLTIAPTTGAVDAGLNLSNANTWLADQTFRDILFSADDTYNLGAATAGMHKAFFSASTSSGTPRAEHSGQAIYTTNADYFIGNDNVFPGFYSQRAVDVNSANTDTSDDFSNLYQGDNSWQFLDVNFGAGDGTLRGGIDALSILRNGTMTVGFYDAAGALGGAGMAIFTRSNRQFLYFVGDEANNRMLMKGSGLVAGMGITSLAEIAVAGVGLTGFLPETDDAVSLGLSGNQWSNVYSVLGTFSGLCTMDSAKVTNAIEIDGALNHDGTTVGFYNVTPVTRPTALTTSLTGKIDSSAFTGTDFITSVPISSAAGTAWGFANQEEFESALNVIENLQTRVDEIESKLQALGLLA